MKRDSKIQRCLDCDAFEGQLHKQGCCDEVCPFCGYQLISCECVYTELKFTDNNKHSADARSRNIYHDVLTNKQREEWNKLLDRKGRYPFFIFPNVCASCGKLWPKLFMVPDEIWKKYIQVNKQNEMLCLNCFNHIVALTNKHSGEKTGFEIVILD